jgi:hypothetical protein
MFTLSTLVSLSVAQLTLGTIVGNLGFGEVASLVHNATLSRSSAWLVWLTW